RDDPGMLEGVDLAGFRAVRQGDVQGVGGLTVGERELRRGIGIEPERDEQAGMPLFSEGQRGVGQLVRGGDGVGHRKGPARVTPPWDTRSAGPLPYVNSVTPIVAYSR